MNDASVPFDRGAFRDRIRQRVLRLRKTSPDPVHFLVVTRTSGNQAVVLSTHDLSVKKGSHAPTSGFWSPPWVAHHRLVAIALALPGVDRVSGDTGGWEMSGRKDRQEVQGGLGPIGGGSPEKFDSAYESMADYMEQLCGVRPIQGDLWSPTIDPDVAISKLREVMRGSTDWNA